MKIEYVIQDVNTHGFWSASYREFKGYLYATWFESEEELLKYVKEENVGIFKITKIYDTK